MSRIPASAFLGEAGWRERPTRPRAGGLDRASCHARGIDHLHATQLATVDVVREVKRMTGVKYSFGVAGSEIYDDARDSRTLRHKVTEAEFVVVPSEVSRQQLLAVTGPGANGNVHRIYRGVDLGTFRYGADAFHDSSAVLAVCPLVEDSGVADLIDAIGRPARAPPRRASRDDRRRRRARSRISGRGLRRSVSTTA